MPPSSGHKIDRTCKDVGGKDCSPVQTIRMKQNSVKNIYWIFKEPLSNRKVKDRND
jgi:hypothetical protein